MRETGNGAIGQVLRLGFSKSRNKKHEIKSFQHQRYTYHMEKKKKKKKKKTTNRL